MTQHLPEFIIVATVDHGEEAPAGRQRVAVGRCGDVPIRKGGHFRSIYRYRKAASTKDLGELPVRTDETAVDLVVVEIQAHNRSLDHLGEGMTGALFLSGDGLARIDKGWVVGQPLHSMVSDNGSQGVPEPAAAGPLR